jgi:hypothetical protein
MENEYEVKATSFLKQTETTFKAKFFKHDYYFTGDKDQRDIYKITLRNKNGSYTFTFGQSIVNTGKQPSAYSVLACLTKYDVGTFHDFRSDFGCNTDSRSDLKTYKAVVKEYENLKRLFTDKELELMSEIQ